MKKSIEGIHAEPDYEQVIFDHLRWIATEQGQVVDPKRRDNGEAYQALARASNNLSDLKRKARIAKRAVNYRRLITKHTPPAKPFARAQDKPKEETGETR